MHAREHRHCFPIGTAVNRYRVRRHLLRSGKHINTLVEVVGGGELLPLVRDPWSPLRPLIGGLLAASYSLLLLFFCFISHLHQRESNRVALPRQHTRACNVRYFDFNMHPILEFEGNHTSAPTDTKLHRKKLFPHTEVNSILALRQEPDIFGGNNLTCSSPSRLKEQLRFCYVADLGRLIRSLVLFVT